MFYDLELRWQIFVFLIRSRYALEKITGREPNKGEYHIPFLKLKHFVSRSSDSTSPGPVRGQGEGNKIA